MSENRETPAGGAPVEETEASRTEVLEAVERAKDSRTGGSERSGGDLVPSADGAGEADGAAPPAAELVEDPDPGTGRSDDDELARRERVSEIDTQLDLEMPASRGTRATAGGLAASDAEPATAAEPEPAPVRAPSIDELPSAADEDGADALGATPAKTEPPVRDGEIRISSDHPMAALYMQTPLPPDLKGNRGAGVWISVLAALVFALVFAGVISLWLAPSLAPSQFVDGLLQEVLSWRFAAAVVAFVIGLVLIVLIVGKAGWWAYVLGGFFVGVLVWFGAALGGAVDAGGIQSVLDGSLLTLIEAQGLAIPAIGAGIVAREVTIWFGAWIGARGRRVKARNSAALAEYEAALTEVSAQS